jgi:hypothetical protein
MALPSRQGQAAALESVRYMTILSIFKTLNVSTSGINSDFFVDGAAGLRPAAQKKRPAFNLTAALKERPAFNLTAALKERPAFNLTAALKERPAFNHLPPHKERSVLNQAFTAQVVCPGRQVLGVCLPSTPDYRSISTRISAGFAA